MTNRPQLVALPGYADRAPDLVFCGHCGRAAAIEMAAPATRVCPRCELGLLIGAPPELAPTPSDPFLLVDSTLFVCGMSARAGGPREGAPAACWRSGRGRRSPATSTSCSCPPTPRPRAPATSSPS